MGGGGGGRGPRVEGEGERVGPACVRVPPARRGGEGAVEKSESKSGSALC